MTQLTVQLYDRSGELRLGPIPATPLFELVARNRQAAVGFADCVGECLTQPDPSRVVIRRPPGLGCVGTSLRLSQDIVGAAVGGYVLTDFTTMLGLQRLARDHGLDFDALWNLARGIAPVPVQRLGVRGAPPGARRGTPPRGRPVA